MTEQQVWLAILVCAAVTAGIRFLPFLIFSGKRKAPAAVEYLGKVLPAAIMAMLVVYCLKDISFSEISGFLPEVLAGGVTVGLYLWRRNTLLSILAGTISYMLLVQLVF